MGKLPDADLLEDLCSRFVLNVPASEHESFDRLMFLVEQAHWFYEDHCRLVDPALQSLSLKAFTGMLFSRCPGLESFRGLLPQIYRSFNSFKSLVPTYGAIFLDVSMQQTLLVRGYHANATWGFPKGKISCNEAEMACAIREVMEETGYDISPKIVEGDFVEMHLGGRGEDGRGQQKCKLFIIQEVDTKEAFLAKTKGEIGAFAWFRINDLPSTAEAARMMLSTESNTTYKMHGVYPFMKQLRLWINKKRRRSRQQSQTANGKPKKQQVEKTGAVEKKGANGKDPALTITATAHEKENGQAILGSSPVSEGQTSKLPSEDGSPMFEKVTANLGGTSEDVQPGQSWLKFRFDRSVIMAKLSIPQPA